MKITREELLAALRRTYPTEPLVDAVVGAPVPVDLPALLTGIAGWESRYEMGAVGDVARVKKKSLGLWQVNQDVWAAAIGAYDLTRVAGDRDAALGYEIDYVSPVVHALLEDLGPTFDRVLRAAAARPIIFDPIASPAEWASIWWQYGAGTFRAWTKSELFRQNATATGFAAWRKTLPDFKERQSFVVREYRRNISALAAKNLAAYWMTESGRLGHDFATPALASLGIPASERELWSKTAAALKPSVRLPSATAAQVDAGVLERGVRIMAPIALFAGLSASVYFLLFEPSPDGSFARRPNREVLAWLKSGGVGLVGTFVLERLKELMP